MNDQRPARLAILISGRGSNMQAFIDACGRGDLNASIALVLRNNPGAAGLTHAASAGITTACIDHREYDSREAFDAAMVAEISRHDPDLVILAGFMRILTPVFIEPFAGKLLNIHPSLLPRYPGTNTHQRAMDAGDQEHGASVHFVTEELDGGPVIGHAAVPIRHDDTAASLQQRIHVEEHRIYPQVVALFAAGRLRMHDGKAWLDNKELPSNGIRLE